MACEFVSGLGLGIASLSLYVLSCSYGSNGRQEWKWSSLVAPSGVAGPGKRFCGKTLQSHASCATLKMAEGTRGYVRGGSESKQCWSKVTTTDRQERGSPSGGPRFAFQEVLMCT